MPGKTKTSVSNTNYFKLYRSSDRATKNQDAKVDKHLTKHPNDAQAIEKPLANYAPSKLTS